MLLALILIPLLAAAGVIFAPAARARNIALIGTLLACAVGIEAFREFPWEASDHFFPADAKWDVSVEAITGQVCSGLVVPIRE